jgi:integrase
MSTARGTVIKRGNSYTVILDLGRDADGNRIRKWHSGYRTKALAEEGRTELLGKTDRGEYVPPNRLTLRQFAEDKWLPALDTAVAGDKLKPNTAASYRTQVNSYVLPRLGHVLLKNISADMLAGLYGELLTSGRKHVREGQPAGLSTTSVRLVHVTIHRMLKDAVRWDLLSRNVADAASKDAPRPRKTGKDTMRVWSPAQLQLFEAHVAKDRLSAMWVLFMYTGLRRGEVAGLQWSDLDLAAGRLTVNRSRVVVNHEVIDSTPKSEHSVRSFALDANTVAALRSHKARQAGERLAWGPAYQGTDLVFVWADGSPLHPNLISRTFARLAKAAKLPVIRVHDLRHSYASAGIKAGVHLKAMQERLGHSSIAITGDIYSHVDREVDQSAADRIAAVISGRGA